MLTKSVKFSIVLAVVLALFAGTAMADSKGRDNHHVTKGDREYQHLHDNKWDNHFRGRHPGNHYYAHRDYGHRNPQRPVYHQVRYQVSKPHPLAPRIVFLGPIPVPVPPPPPCSSQLFCRPQVIDGESRADPGRGSLVNPNSLKQISAAIRKSICRSVSRLI